MKSWVFAVVIFLALLSVWCLFRDALLGPPLIYLIICMAACGVLGSLPFMQRRTRWGTIRNVFVLLTVAVAFSFLVVSFAAITIPAHYQAGHLSYLQGHKYSNVLFLWSLLHLAVTAVFGSVAWCIQRFKLRRY